MVKKLISELLLGITTVIKLKKIIVILANFEKNNKRVRNVIKEKKI